MPASSSDAGVPRQATQPATAPSSLEQGERGREGRGEWIKGETPCAGRRQRGSSHKRTAGVAGAGGSSQTRLDDQLSTFVAAAAGAAERLYKVKQQREDQAKRMRAAPQQPAATDVPEEGPATTSEDATDFWQRLTSAGSSSAISEFIKVAQIAFTIVPGSVDPERAFSNLKYLKDQQRNRLIGEHLSACVRMFSQQWFTVKSFPIVQAVRFWKQGAKFRQKEHK